MDSGALSSNYISKSFLSAHSELLPFIVSEHSRVCLGDGQTIRDLYGYVDGSSLELVFTHSDHQEVIVSVDFEIFDTVAFDIIIGLPTIRRHLPHFFSDVVLFSGNVAHQSSLAALDLELVQPWSTIIPTPPEEDIIPLPCSFTCPLNYLSKVEGQAEREYLDLFDTHVEPSFLADQRVRKLLEGKGKRVFVPQNWTGVTLKSGDQFIVDLEWSDDFPLRRKPRSFKVSPKLMENAEKEFKRLLTYHLTPCDSPVASELVIAPKATDPFLRFCANYPWLKPYMVYGHYPIPRPKEELEKIKGFRVFADLDMTNSFHQFKLGQLTSSRLSVQTIWGQVRPIFMPEGIPQASAILHKFMTGIFEDYSDFMVVIFDNILVLGKDTDDLLGKLELVFDRCILHNVFLKFTKTWLGFTQVQFFGYLVTGDGYKLTDKRLQALNAVPFPKSSKEMMIFLGGCLFCDQFIPHYSSYTAPLHEMTGKLFVWNEDKWTKNYRSLFQDFKDVLLKALSVFYPDYSLDWILCTDASEVGISACLYQVSGDSLQLLACVSKKLSEPASRWDPYRAEGYAIFWGVFKLQRWLRAKPFIIKTDHANLQYMEQSLHSPVIRQLTYLQAFNIDGLVHIKGSDNKTQDLFSRLTSSIGRYSISEIDHRMNSPVLATLTVDPIYEVSASLLIELALSASSDELTRDLLAALPILQQKGLDVDELLHKVHGGRRAHWGAHKTWQLLCKEFPGHHVPYAVVEEHVRTCGVCAKDRLGRSYDIRAELKTHKDSLYHKKTVGMDLLQMPEDDEGYTYISVISNFLSKRCRLFRQRTKTAEDSASSLWSYITQMGWVFDNLRTDLGSDYTSTVFSLLQKWLGYDHSFATVDRPQGSNVEGTNHQVVRHTRALVYDNRLELKWSTPEVLGTVEWFINGTYNSEVDGIPIHIDNGNVDQAYLCLPPTDMLPAAKAHAYTAALGKTIAICRENTIKFASELHHKRTQESPAAALNKYQAGDYVLTSNMNKQHKLHPRWLGPCVVLSHTGNDVHIKHLVTDAVSVRFVTDVHLWSGSPSEALRMARIDHAQYSVASILAYRGEPEERLSLQFLILYEDGDKRWSNWGKDITDTLPFEDFCNSVPCLRGLLLSAAEAAKLRTSIRNQDITLVKPGDTAFINLRTYGYSWYAALQLPDFDVVDYVIECTFEKWAGPRRHPHRLISLRNPLFNTSTSMDNYFIVRHGSQLLHLPGQVIVDTPLVTRFPSILAEVTHA